MIKTMHEYVADQEVKWQPATDEDATILRYLYYEKATKGISKTYGGIIPNRLTITLSDRLVRGRIELRFIIAACDRSTPNVVWGLFIANDRDQLHWLGGNSIYPVRFTVVHTLYGYELKNHKLLWCKDLEHHTGLVNASPR